MEIDIVGIDGKIFNSLGKVDFKVPELKDGVRIDIMKEVVRWQLAKRRAGTHQTKDISGVSGTTAKPHKQKGTGRARQGSLRSVQFRGGGIAHGPVSHSHEFSLNKKLRRLGLISALTFKAMSGGMLALKDVSWEEPSTKKMSELFADDLASGYKVLVVVNQSVCNNLQRSFGNLARFNLIRSEGVNVYDLLRHDRVVLLESVIGDLEKRLYVRKESV